MAARTGFRMDTTDSGAAAPSSSAAAAASSPRSPLASAPAPGTYATMPPNGMPTASGSGGGMSYYPQASAYPPLGSYQQQPMAMAQPGGIPMAIPVSPGPGGMGGNGNGSPRGAQPQYHVPMAIPVSLPGMFPPAIELHRVAPRTTTFRLVYPRLPALLANPALDAYMTSVDYDTLMSTVNLASDVGAGQAAAMSFSLGLGIALLVFGVIVFAILWILLGSFLLVITSSGMRVQRVRAIARISAVLDSVNPSFMDGATRRKMPFFVTFSGYDLVFMAPAPPPTMHMTMPQQLV